MIRNQTRKTDFKKRHDHLKLNKHILCVFIISELTITTWKSLFGTIDGNNMGTFPGKIIY